MSSQFVSVQDLEVYQLARELSRKGWAIYIRLTWQQKKVIGDQFISSVDSVGANIVEGYNRYHYLDKIKFYYISRGSLAESCDHWLELLYERKFVTEQELNDIKALQKNIGIKLNNFIKSTYNNKR